MTRAANDNLPEYTIGITAIARRLHVSRSQATRLHRTRKLPTFVRDGKVVCRTEELIEWVNFYGADLDGKLAPEMRG